MTLLSTRSKKLSGVLAFELDSEYGITRETATVVVETGMDVGAAVARTLISPTGTPVTVGTGDGVMGAITVSKRAEVGVYVLRIVKAAANAGDFTVTSPAGVVIGTGSVAVACVAGPLSFTLADGAADFVVGDIINITVAGTVKYEWIEAADVSALVDDVCVVIESDKDVPSLAAGDHSLTLLARGEAGVVGASLLYKDTLTTDQKNVVLAKLKAKGIQNRTKV